MALGLFFQRYGDPSDVEGSQRCVSQEAVQRNDVVLGPLQRAVRLPERFASRTRQSSESSLPDLWAYIGGSEAFLQAPTKNIAFSHPDSRAKQRSSGSNKRFSSRSTAVASAQRPAKWQAFRRLSGL